MASRTMESYMGLQEMIETAEGLQAVPEAFVRPPLNRPPPTTDLQEQQVPIVDLSRLHDPHKRPLILQKIADACIHWGFFQVVNHGVKDEVVQEMRAACWRFFDQPASERNKLKGHEHDKPVVYSTSFNPAVEKIRNWKDVLYVRDLPGVCCNGFDLVPELCRDAFRQYRSEVQKLANQLLECVFEGLGLSREEIQENVPPPGRLVMGVNLYPACPDPSLTYGAGPHSDIGYLTVLLQDEVPGLQIKKGSDWFLVKPVPNAFVINVADQIEILSNGRYKSIEHSAATNTEKSRMSIVCFFGPLDSATVAPLPELTSDREPARYKAVKFGDYVSNLFMNELQPNKGTLGFAR